MKKQFWVGFVLGILLVIPFVVVGAPSIAERLAGRFLLQVEGGGRVWYVSPVDNTRYEVTFGNALPLFKKLALGISNKDLAAIPEAQTLAGELLESKYCVKETIYVHDDGTTQTIKQEADKSWVNPPVDSGTPKNSTPGGTTGTTNPTQNPDTTTTVPQEEATEPVVAPTLTFESDKASVLVGGSVILKWSAVGADSCTLKIGNDEPISVETSGVRNEIIKHSTWYLNLFTVTCTNSKGSVYKQVKITGTPIVYMSANALPTSFLSSGMMRDLSKVTPILSAEIADKTTTKLYYRINKSIDFAVKNIKLYKYSSSGDVLIGQSDISCEGEECLYEFTINEPLFASGSIYSNPVQYTLKGDIVGSLGPGSVVYTTLYNIDYTGKLYDQEITEPTAQTMIR